MLTVRGSGNIESDFTVPRSTTVAIDDERGIYLVAQGLGTDSACRTAVKFGVQSFLDFLAPRLASDSPVGDDGNDLVSLVNEAIQHTCQVVHGIGMRNPEFQGLSAVASILIRVATKMVLAHVGNCRVYLIRNGEVHLLTREHSLAQDMVRRGMMTSEEASLSEYRAVVTRALGRERGVQVDTILFDVLPGDVFALFNAASTELVGGVAELESSLRTMQSDDLEGAVGGMFSDVSGADGSRCAWAVIRAFDTTPPEQAEILRREEVSLKIDTLQRMFIFQELTLEELLKVLEVVSVYDCKASEVLVREGDIGDHFFVILDGEMEVVVGDRKVGMLASGNHFGEIAILIDRPRIATVRASRDSRLLVIPRHAFQRLIYGEQGIGVKLLFRLSQELAQRLTQTTERLA